jgi:hypothetical protein
VRYFFGSTRVAQIDQKEKQIDLMETIKKTD